MADYIVIPALIATAESKTAALNISNYFVTHIEVPASMTGTTLTLEAGSSATSTVPVRNEDNTNFSITINNAAAIYPVDAKLTAGVQFIKIVSGSAESGAKALKIYGYKL